MAEIIARKREQSELKRLYDSGKAEFVVVYGRRRVGKTYLVREYFSGNFDFYHTALSPYDKEGAKTTTAQQLQCFHSSLVRFGDSNPLVPKDWLEALERLRDLVEGRLNKGKRTVVFIDELPWLDIAKSGFVPAFEHFWNGWGAGCQDLILIVCGSATTWIHDTFLDNTGGLYNRITAEIRVSPFSLSECEDFYRSRSVEISRYDQLQYYMILGGVPYYMDYLRRGESLAANIDSLFFNKDSRLRNEFDRLFASLFKKPEGYKELVRFLAGSRAGYTREEITSGTSYSSGGGLTEALAALEASDFILKYRPFAAKKGEEKYKLIDGFLLFYLKFVDGVSKKNSGYWQRFENTSKLTSWRGLSFENLCFNHIPQIKNALGISGVYTEESAWIRQGNDIMRGAQIDMLIDRDDRIINLCEMKFVLGDYSVSKEEEAKLQNRKAALYESGTKKAVNLVLVTTYGLKQNAHSAVFQKVVTMEDLFCPQKG